jgi:membrane fusion protein, heavy metal efflux system
MKTASAMVALFALLFIGCTDRSAGEHSHGNGHEHSHEHESDGPEPLSYTIYTDKTELFVEFKPLVVGSKSNFAAHFTILGETFLPLTEGSVTVSLIVGETGLRNRSDSASSPGIFRLAIIPKTAGTGRLVFDIETKEYTDQIVIEDITVYRDEQTAKAQQSETTEAGEVTFLKEQAWRLSLLTHLLLNNHLAR